METLKSYLDEPERNPLKLYPFFRHIPIVEQFVEAHSFSFFQRLTPHIRYLTLRPHEVLQEAQKPVNFMLFLAFGAIRKEPQHEIISAPDSVEEVAFLTRTASRSSYTTAELCLICTVHKEDFNKVINPKKVAMSLIYDLLAFGFFSDFSINFLEQITQRSNLVTYVNHQSVLGLGDYWYIVRKGEFQLSHLSSQGRVVPLALMVAGECFGELEILGHNVVQRAKCISHEGQLFEIPKLELLNLLQRFSRFAQAMHTQVEKKVTTYRKLLEKAHGVLALPLFQVREKPKPAALENYVKIRKPLSIQQSVEQLQLESKREFCQLMQNRTQRLAMERDLTNSERLRERNPRLHRFLEQMDQMRLKMIKGRRKKTEEKKEQPQYELGQGKTWRKGSHKHALSENTTLVSPSDSIRVIRLF